ncbi:hypothetical protein TWF217_007942 [Orbilia oligospora]|nr:hypothetical protein TWF217_007942 [Orbilia oligospora]
MFRSAISIGAADYGVPKLDTHAESTFHLLTPAWDGGRERLRYQLRGHNLTPIRISDDRSRVFTTQERRQASKYLSTYLSKDRRPTCYNAHGHPRTSEGHSEINPLIRNPGIRKSNKNKQENFFLPTGDVQDLT